MKLDAFTHIVTPKYRKRVDEILAGRSDEVARGHEGALVYDPTLTDLDARFELMDKLGGGDYRQVLVMGHFSVEQEDAPIARDLARLGNEELAAVAAAHPDRFVGWVAQTAIHDDSRGFEAIRECIDEGALGVQVFTDTRGRCLDHPDYEPFFALMAELDRPIWIHPNRTLSDFPTEAGPRFGMHALAGWPHETAVTMARLVYAGYLERWPELKIIVHHSGGTVPMIAGRLKEVEAGEETAQIRANLTAEPLDYLRRFYTDTANFSNPIALRAALEFFGPDHILFGTDFGFDIRFGEQSIADIETVVQDPAQKQKIYEDNARRFLSLDD